MIKLLNIIGIDDTNTITVNFNDGLLKNAAFGFQGNVSFLENINNKNINILTVYIGGIEQKKELSMSKPDLVFNSICSADTNKKTLHMLEKLVERSDVPVINHPSNILKTTRDGIAALFEKEPFIHVPKTKKITPRSRAEVARIIREKDFSYPVIFRSATEHGGKEMVRLDTENDLVQLEQFALDGRPYYLIKFVDFKSPDGLYRKARIIMIDGTPYPRHLIVSDSWNIHAESRSGVMKENKRLQEEEEGFLKGLDPKVKEACRKIYEKVGLDCFGIDCNIDKEGKMTIFEINACMRAFGASAFSYHDTYTAKIKEALEAMIVRKSGKKL